MPRDFTTCINTSKFIGIRLSDLKILQDPEHEEYYDAWTDVLDKAVHIDESLNKWRLWQDGDLWMVCPELMSDDDYYNFYGEERI